MSLKVYFAVKPACRAPRLWALAHERRKGMTADILEMDSYYFFCQVGQEQEALRLDRYEAAEHFTPVWVEQAHALRANQARADGTHPWIRREVAVMERLKAFMDSQ